MAGVKQYKALELVPADIAATGNGAGVDLSPYVSSPFEIMAVLSGEKMGASQTCDVKIQHSDDNQTFADITGAAFTQVGNTAAAFEAIFFQTNKRYIRAVVTASASAAGAVCVTAFVLDRNV